MDLHGRSLETTQLAFLRRITHGCQDFVCGPGKAGTHRSNKRDPPQGRIRSFGDAASKTDNRVASPTERAGVATRRVVLSPMTPANADPVVTPIFACTPWRSSRSPRFIPRAALS